MAPPASKIVGAVLRLGVGGGGLPWCFIERVDEPCDLIVTQTDEPALGATEF